MKDKFFTIFGALTPIAKEMLKKRGIDIDNMSFEDILKHVNSILKESDLFKQDSTTNEGSYEKCYQTAEGDSTIQFSDKDEDGKYNITVELAGFNKTNTELEYIPNERILYVRAKKENHPSIIKTISLDEKDTIISSSMSDGILTINIQSEVIKFEKIIIN